MVGVGSERLGLMEESDSIRLKFWDQTEKISLFLTMAFQLYKYYHRKGKCGAKEAHDVSVDDKIFRGKDNDGELTIQCDIPLKLC